MLASIHKLSILLLLLITTGLGQKAMGQVWTLEQCLDTAAINNKNLQIGRNKVDLSLEKQKEVKANLIPKVSLNADYKYFTNLPYQLMPLSVFGGPDGQFQEAQFGVPHNISANLQFSMPLTNPELNGAIRSTKIATQLSDLQLKKSKEQIYFEISNLYYNAQILQHQLAFIDSNLVNSRKLLKNVELLAKQLLAKGTDVRKVALQVEQLSSRKHMLTSKIEQVLNGLKFAMGVSPERNIQVKPEIKYKEEKEFSAKATLDIRLINTQQSLLSNQLRTLKNSRLPTIALYGSFGTTGYGYDQSPNEFLDFYPVGFAGVKLSYPIFNGTVTQKKIKQKNLEINNNQLQMQLVRAQNEMQMSNARLQKSVAQNTVEMSLSQMELARTVYKETVIQQQQGLAALSDVLLADNAMRETQQDYLSAIVDYLKANLELKKLSGNILK